MSEAVLFDYHRSSASYRVRIALALAGIGWESVVVDLVAGEQRDAAHRERNPQGFVPVLDIDGLRLTQSLAIVEYLNDTRQLELLPAEPGRCARVRALAHALAVDVHPVCNLGVVTHATGGEEPARTDWMRHFIAPGMAAFERLLDGFEQRPFCTGDSPSLADICLMPQWYNAERWGADISACPRIGAVAAACADHPAFMAAHPDIADPTSQARAREPMS